MGNRRIFVDFDFVPISMKQRKKKNLCIEEKLKGSIVFRLGLLRSEHGQY